MKITVGNQVIKLNNDSTVQNTVNIKEYVSQILNVNEDEFYVLRNGKITTQLSSEGLNDSELSLCVIPRILGGKGGFGSMLRAIGAQIEKTTNRDACRDLSGRRLRDINEEQRLKRWFAKQKERELEREEARKRKLEKLKQLTEGPPLPAIDDQQYNKQRSDMADSVFDAVDKGFESIISQPVTDKTSSDSEDSKGSTDSSKNSAKIEHEDEAEKPGPSSSSTTTVLLPTLDVGTSAPAKKKTFRKTLLDEDLDSCSSSEDDEETPTKKIKLA